MINAITRSVSASFPLMIWFTASGTAKMIRLIKMLNRIKTASIIYSFFRFFTFPSHLCSLTSSECFDVYSKCTDVTSAGLPPSSMSFVSIFPTVQIVSSSESSFACCIQSSINPLVTSFAFCKIWLTRSAYSWLCFIDKMTFLSTLMILFLFWSPSFAASVSLHSSSYSTRCRFKFL